MGNIYFFKEDYKIDLRKLRKHKNWLNKVANSYDYKITELNYIFCSDKYLHKINLEYLNHDTYTDIITFDLKEDYEGKDTIEADIFISIDRVTENAINLQINHEMELVRVMAHGLLHLMGFGDKTDAEKKEMRAEENKAIELL
jgi:probable rRNA maturation factor